MPLLVGIVLAAATILGARLAGLDRDRALYPVVLVVVALPYILFASMTRSTGVILSEAVVALPFLALMHQGFRVSLWWIVAGLAAHGMLDTVHAHLIPNPGVPEWWPAFCASYDIAAALGLAIMLRKSGRRSVRIAATAATVTALVAGMSRGTLSAQDASPPRARPVVSVSLATTRPVGDLGRNIGSGYGAAAAFLLPITRTGWLSLRADVGASQYGSESRRTAFSESVGDRVEVKVRTANYYVPASVGLQLTLPAGPVFPYANAGVGMHAFYTESSVEPTFGGQALVSSVNQSDVTAAWTLGGGVYIPVRVGRVRAQLDLNAQYIQGGTTKYLAPGSITDLPGGHISISPMESSTHVVALRVGARFGL
jgi:opacity protein-like surface antigen